MRSRKWQKNVSFAGLVGLLVLAVLTMAQAPADAAETRAQGSRDSQVWQLTTGREIPASVQRAAIDPASGAVYLATLADLFEVRDGRATPIAERPRAEARLVLAPDGGMYAWLIPDEAPDHPSFARLVDISGRSLADLKLEKAPFGFGQIHLGSRGRLIVTVAALDDWQGAHGRFLYAFWSRDGNLLGTVTRPNREIGVVSADGKAFLLLGEKEALAFSPDGEVLWRLDGRFRKAALAADGRVALLNPADREAIDRVYVFLGTGRPSVVTMPSPVHKLRLTPDGSAAVVTGSGGRYFFLDPATGGIDEGVKLPFDAALFISDIEIVDRETVALGVLERHGDPPQHSWPLGSLVVINRGGDVEFRSQYAIREPFSSRPAVDAAFGSTKFIGFTLDTAVLVELGR